MHMLTRLKPIRVSGRLLLGCLSIGFVLLASPMQGTVAQSSPPQCTVSKVYVEVTQATQVDPASSTTPVPLVDGRRTGVRVYVIGTPFNCVGPLANVRLTSTPFVVARPSLQRWSENGPLMLKGSGHTREAEDDSFNFEFTPSGWDGAQYNLLAEVFQVDGSGNPFSEAMKTHSKSVYLNKMCPPDIAAVRVDQQHYPVGHGLRGAPAESKVVEGIGDAMLWGANPFPEYSRGFAHGGGYRLEDDVLVISALPTVSQIFSSLHTKRAGMDPQPDHIVGWLKTNASDDPGGVGGRGERPGTGSYTVASSSYKATNAMEVGHNFGYTHDQFGATIDEVGWDVWKVMGPEHVREKDNIEFMFGGSVTVQVSRRAEWANWRPWAA